ncbi:MAG: magnesium transporter [Polyangiaceae bacterium]
MRVAVAIVPEVRELLREDPTQLSALLDEIHDEDLADLLELLEEDEAMLVLDQLRASEAADIFERLDDEAQAELVERFGARHLAPIVSEMAPDDRVDFIENLPDRMGEQLLDEMDPAAAREVEQLIGYPDDTAGGLMTTDLVRLSPELTVAAVIQKLREEAQDAETIYYIYGVEASGTLAGVASLRDIILAEPETPLREVMSEHVHSVLPTLDQEEVARVLRKYDFTAMPVVDEQQRLLGLITIDDVMDVVEEEQDEDVQRLAAVEPIEEDYFRTSFWTFISKRAPWLAVLFVGQFITEAILRRYDPVIQAVTQLTYYLPMLVSTGGNSGAQSASLIIRSIATGDVVIDDWWRVLRRELGQGLVLGSMLAAVGMLRVYMAGDVSGMATTIGATVVAIVVVGCTVGAMLPLLLRRLGLDPATSSTPFIATLVDVFGIVLYFTIANVVLAGVIGRAMPPAAP